MLFPDPVLGRPLPVGSPIHSDESGNGYALRMARMNGISFAELVSLIASPGHRYVSAKAAPVLAYLFGAGTAAVRRAIPELRSSAGRMRVLFMGHILNRAYLVRHTRPQICPVCLDEFGYARAVWDLALSIACEVHHVALIDHCDVCDRRLSWRRPSLTTCWCGHLLSEWPRVAVAPDMTEWSLLLVSHFKNAAMPRSGWAFDCLRGLSFDALQRLVRVCGLSATYAGVRVSPGTLVRHRSSEEARRLVELGLLRSTQLSASTGGLRLIGDDLCEGMDDVSMEIFASRFGLQSPLYREAKTDNVQLDLFLKRIDS